MKADGLKITSVMCIGIALCMLDTTIMNIALPAVQSNLHLSLGTMSWVLNVYGLAIAVLSIPMGKLGEVVGKGRLYVVGLFLFGMASTLSALAQNGSVLIVGRLLQGIGAAILFPLSMVIGVSSVSLARRNTALTLLGVTQGLAAAIGPALGGIITQYLGWRWVFTINIPICVMSLGLCFYYLQIRTEARMRTRIDWLGAILCGIGIYNIVRVLQQGNDWGWHSQEAILSYSVGTVALILFVIVEWRSKSPMVPLKLFRDRVFNSAVLTIMIGNIFLIGVTVLLPLFLTHVQGRTELNAALLLTSMSGAIFIAAVPSTVLMRKLGSPVSIFLGFSGISVAYILLEQLSNHSNWLSVMAACITMGLGYGLIVGPITVLSASNFENELLTASQTTLAMFRQVGIVLAIAIFVSALSHNIQSGNQAILQHTKADLHNTLLPETVQRKIFDSVQSQLAVGGVQNGESAATTETGNPFAVSHNQASSVITDVKVFIQKTVSDDFTALYRHSWPFVLVSGLIGLLSIGAMKQLNSGVPEGCLEMISENEVRASGRKKAGLDS